MDNMRILMAASEVIPFAKTGGLADVAGSLPKALQQLGQDVRVIMPKYGCIPQEYVKDMELIGHTYVNLGWREQYCGVFKLVHNGVTIYFLDNEYYFKRDGLYGYGDEAEQFTFFCKGILAILPVIGFKPDIIHCNDWQTGLVSMLLNANYRDQEFYKNIKTIMTIHNLRYQGIFPKEVLPDIIGAGWEYFTPDGIEYKDCVNFLKAGIAFSDIITTVSKTYADEIKYDFFGEGLNGLLNRRADSLHGILNGIDVKENDPATDKRIFANFDLNNLEGKYKNKKMLQKSLGLPQKDNVPLIGIISRFVDQKGFDLISCVFEEILNLGVQVVILGAGEYRYESFFRHMAYVHKDKVSTNTKYDSLLAQRIYAASDMFLMPSLFEPCGLSQMFSLRYGTIPIVRETGGLNDTIRSYNEVTQEGNGFSFKNYNAHDMLYTINRAIEIYKKKDLWTELIRRGMQEDFSWDASAREYEQLYDSMLK